MSGGGKKVNTNGSCDISTREGREAILAHSPVRGGEGGGLLREIRKKGQEAA